MKGVYIDESGSLTHLVLGVRCRARGGVDRDSERVRLALERRYCINVTIRRGCSTNSRNDWLELTVRFIVREHGIRNIKDAKPRAGVSEIRCGILSLAKRPSRPGTLAESPGFISR